jgi:predicted DNA-binding transcriptional regulator AlpA
MTTPVYIQPRGLRRKPAAVYVGFSPSKFDELVKDGRMPQPKRVDGCVIWDTRKLDEAFEALGEDGDHPWEGAT